MPATDFDFLHGRWRVANRKVVDMLDPQCDRWREFETSWETRAMLGGLGNVDHIRAADGVRFDWTEVTAASARWEQAFSFDGGATWKPNWVMLLERA